MTDSKVIFALDVFLHLMQFSPHCHCEDVFLHPKQSIESFNNNNVVVVKKNWIASLASQ
jgi:hypothetical protein